MSLVSGSIHGSCVLTIFTRSDILDCTCRLTVFAALAACALACFAATDLVCHLFFYFKKKMYASSKIGRVRSTQTMHQVHTQDQHGVRRLNTIHTTQPSGPRLKRSSGASNSADPPCFDAFCCAWKRTQHTAAAASSRAHPPVRCSGKPQSTWCMYVRGPTGSVAGCRSADRA
jgi:hypothetical protein